MKIQNVWYGRFSENSPSVIINVLIVILAFDFIIHMYMFKSHLFLFFVEEKRDLAYLHKKEPSWRWNMAG